MYIYKYIIFKTIFVFQKDTRIACFFLSNQSREEYWYFQDFSSNRQPDENKIFSSCHQQKVNWNMYINLSGRTITSINSKFYTKKQWDVFSSAKNSQTGFLRGRRMIQWFFKTALVPDFRSYICCLPVFSVFLVNRVKARLLLLYMYSAMPSLFNAYSLVWQGCKLECLKLFTCSFISEG